ncbi:MAG TPA: DUF3365 domain-containing protein [Saprospiraceae bacterium]|nr:DUF3365 domain-containing protein [Saprospiraceae bacterium]HMQ84879.1 DUF3365 domain-containing protein [Saprospiraceae bacterium]
MANPKRFALVTLVLALLGSSCSQQADKAKAEERKAAFEEKGQQIVAASFAALSAQLQQALQRGGVPEALSYCHLAAHPLVDSLSKVHSAGIKRTSLRLRNPANAPTSEEKEALAHFEKAIQNGESLQPYAQLLEGKEVAYYAPIQINALCLQCHGKVGSDIKTVDAELIAQLYPQDQATGYVDGEWRGIWSIRLSKDALKQD